MGKQPATPRQSKVARAEAQQEPAPTPEPPSLSIREVRANVEKRFNCFGTEECSDTIVPAGKSNNAHIAAEFFLSDILRKMANTRFESAKAAADEAGLFGDETTWVEGEAVMTFSCPDFNISVKKGKPTKMLDREKLTLALTDILKDPKKVAEVIKAAEKDRAGPTTITTAMK